MSSSGSETSDTDGELDPVPLFQMRTNKWHNLEFRLNPQQKIKVKTKVMEVIKTMDLQAQNNGIERQRTGGLHLTTNSIDAYEKVLVYL